MSGRLREIARQTVEIADSGHYRNGAGDEVGIGELVRAAVAGTRLHLPDEVPAVGNAEPGGGRVEVTYESTLQAARRLAPAAACLVFASAKNPGGGFLGGAKAQEESVARSSALYPCLLAAPEFYAFHREQRDLRYSDRVIFSPDVPVFRDDKGNLLDQPYTTSFLTAAAPNLGAILRNQPEHVADVPAVLARRARRVLEVAAAHGHRTLVLGAWGCGVFRNDPATVADAFAYALREVDRFDHVVFAIHDNLPGTPVYRTFAERFDDRNALTDPNRES
ncbi:TIGR02452 family protein [Micromonospora parathelypteridis]|uniref:TIGR02452 family protein n=1 Tax=Micromonospora parathelypteridis TaxID=1839617 RepID=UPI001616DB64|nr:TIGR02452 family protein [Micromonospora parathelypteridis]GGO25493.1 TIGR02452 family protein [Micromonospora parathelypteridis]